MTGQLVQLVLSRLLMYWKILQSCCIQVILYSGMKAKPGSVLKRNKFIHLLVSELECVLFKKITLFIQFHSDGGNVQPQGQDIEVKVTADTAKMIDSSDVAIFS